MPEATSPNANPASPTTAAATKVEMRKMAAKSVGSRPCIIKASQPTTRPNTSEQHLDGVASVGEAAVSPINDDMEMRTGKQPTFTEKHGRQARPQIQARRRQSQGAVQ